MSNETGDPPPRVRNEPVKTVLVTGTSSGLGQSLFRLLSHQVRLVAFSRRYTREQELAAAARPEEFRLILADLAEIASVETALQGIGGMDWARTTHVVFINNAGAIEPLKGIGQFTAREMAVALNVNLLASALIMNDLEAKRRNAGFRLKVINVTSRAADIPTVGWSLYGSAKSGAQAFFENYRCQTQAEGRVDVCLFDPGLMDTPMQEKIRAAHPQEVPDVGRFVEYYSTGALQSPDVVAKRLINECRVLCD